VSKKKPRIIIAAGGTGGHVFPAIAIADEIKKINPNAEFLFVGTKGKIEERVVLERGYAFAKIWISGFHRSLRLDNFLFPLRVCVSLFQSFFLISKFKPDAVIGTGGYVCGPVLFIASILGIMTIVHESNSYPGITTRMLSSRATKIFTAFDVTARWLHRKDNIEVIGTPARSVLGTVSHKDGIQFFNLNPSKKTVLLFGGSLGAASINRAAREMLNDLSSLKIQVIWQVGKNDQEMVKEMSGIKNCWIDAFIDKMEYAYAAADLVVCRSGAMTLAELTLLGKPAILVPYPYAAADHQTFNAQTLVGAGGAVMISDKEIQAKLKNEITSLISDDKKLKQMSDASRKIGSPNAGREIAHRILQMI
jgi:UDP-N-acetylglucosamine--N-acetylmuramyl-(pentapeptide) pyrophosphoryl-undecaprenol N-acetylglucosamine transferase